jgi:DNA-binding SARP family transcriptional activator
MVQKTSRLVWDRQSESHTLSDSILSLCVRAVIEGVETQASFLSEGGCLMSTLRIVLFGPMRVCRSECGSGEVRLPPGAQALLAYLLLGTNRFYPRDVLAELSWGDRAEDQARRCLNTALWRLRSFLEPDGTARGTYLITTSSGQIGFNWQSDHWLDHAIFAERSRQFLALPASAIGQEHASEIEQTLELYTGDLLEGLYDDWALRERERFHTIYLTCLARLMRYYRRQGISDRAIACGEDILRDDPLREEIHRELMHLYHESGQRGLALRQYEHCRDVLQAEMGIPPMEETEALYAEIRGREAQPPVPGGQGRENPPDMQHALQHLSRAARSLDAAREELGRAMRAVESLSAQM